MLLRILITVAALYIFSAFAFVYQRPAAHPPRQPQNEIVVNVGTHPFAGRCHVYAPPPPEQIDAFIKRAERIVWVRAISSELNPISVWEIQGMHAQNVIYELDTIETLKGSEAPYRIRIPGVSVRHELGIDPDLLDVGYRHAKALAGAKDMYEAQGSSYEFRVAAKRNLCEFAPRFEIGMTYLLFLPDAFSPISAEPLLGRYDPWYERVSIATRGQGPSWGLY
jgi:hypothetical protein